VKDVAVCIYLQRVQASVQFSAHSAATSATTAAVTVTAALKMPTVVLPAASVTDVSVAGTAAPVGLSVAALAIGAAVVYV
jgi:hypothetical protein